MFRLNVRCAFTGGFKEKNLFLEDTSAIQKQVVCQCQASGWMP